MKLRLTKSEHQRLAQARAILGMDNGEIVRRALRCYHAGRVAPTPRLPSATRDGSTVLTLTVPDHLAGDLAHSEIRAILCAALVLVPDEGAFTPAAVAGRDYVVEETTD